MLPITKIAPKPRNSKYPHELITLGDHIRTKRLDLGLEQKDLAKLIGVTTSCMVNWELKHSVPEIRYYPKIDDFLGYCIIQYPKTEGERLRLYREHLGYTTVEMAEFLGVDTSSVQSWESDEHKPTRKSKEKMEKLWRMEEE